MIEPEEYPPSYSEYLERFEDEDREWSDGWRWVLATACVVVAVVIGFGWYAYRT